MTPNHTTDNNIQGCNSKGVVKEKYIPPIEYFAIDIYPYYTFFETTNEVKPIDWAIYNASSMDRFPKDDEHDFNKI